LLLLAGYSVVQGPRTSMVRPHPALWRLVHGAAVVYVLLLVWLLFQTAHDARQFMKVRQQPKNSSSSSSRDLQISVVQRQRLNLAAPGGRSSSWRASCWCCTAADRCSLRKLVTVGAAQYETLPIDYR
jgi:hypothetical protein